MSTKTERASLQCVEKIKYVCSMIDTDTNSEYLGLKSIHFVEQVLSSGSNPDLVCANPFEISASVPSLKALGH